MDAAADAGQAYRYALYAVPPADHPLSALAIGWLGRDAACGAVSPQAAVPGLEPERFSALTAEARRYGFHGTLKAPFRLAEGVGEADLLAAFEEFRDGQVVCPVRLCVADDLGFLALRPVDEVGAIDPSRENEKKSGAGILPAAAARSGGNDHLSAPPNGGRDARPTQELIQELHPEDALHALADDCVRRFDAFRAALSPAELERRLAARLSERQQALVRGWGYPYVFDQFRFHMTLADRPRDAAEAQYLREAAEYWFRRALVRPVPLEVRLFVERRPGLPFRQIVRQEN